MSSRNRRARQRKAKKNEVSNKTSETTITATSSSFFNFSDLSKKVSGLATYATPIITTGASLFSFFGKSEAEKFKENILKNLINGTYIKIDLAEIARYTEEATYYEIPSRLENALQQLTNETYSLVSTATNIPFELVKELLDIFNRTVVRIYTQPNNPDQNIPEVISIFESALKAYNEALSSPWNWIPMVIIIPSLFIIPCIYLCIKKWCKEPNAQEETRPLRTL